MQKTFKIALTILLLLTLAISTVGCGNVEKDDQDPTGKQDTQDQTETVDYTTKQGNAETVYTDAKIIVLNGDTATIDGTALPVYDYTWHCDPSAPHKDVKNAPAVYYTGSLPEESPAFYVDNDLEYYPELPTSGFQKVTYDGETEWAYYYTDGENNAYIFATLPCFQGMDSSIPTQMMHSETEAAQNKVLHINEAGTYILEGTWNGQISVDLGEDAFTDETAVVTLVLNGAEITCTVAPGLIFENVYECHNTWEDEETHSQNVVLTNTGANVVVADGSVNTIDGQNVYRMLKTKYKDETVTNGVQTQKKYRKTDAAFYSFMTMTVTGGNTGDGILHVVSSFEGMDSELHLQVNGGKIYIDSQDDGTNVNEDNVSIFFMNGGYLTLNPAQGAEGDGIDSNGYIVINGGTLSVNGVTAPDSALDSEDGAYYNGGTVIIDGQTQSYKAGDVIRESFGGGQGFPGGNQGQFTPGGTDPFSQTFDIKSFKEAVAALGDNATLQDVLNLLGLGNFNQGGQSQPGGNQGQFNPDGQTQQGGAKGQFGPGGQMPQGGNQGQFQPDGQTQQGGQMPQGGNQGQFQPDGQTQQGGQMPQGNMQGQSVPDGTQTFGQDFDVTSFKASVAALSDNATLQDVLNLLGFGNANGQMQQGAPGQMPDGQTTNPWQ